jgi:hypothetical protein
VGGVKNKRTTGGWGVDKKKKHPFLSPSKKKDLGVKNKGGEIMIP